MHPRTRRFALAAAAAALPLMAGCNNAGQGLFSGAALGGLAGLGLGSLSGNAGAGAAAGAIIGGVAGGVIGDQNARNASYANAYASGGNRVVYVDEGPDHVVHTRTIVRPVHTYEIYHGPTYRYHHHYGSRRHRSHFYSSYSYGSGWYCH